MFLKYDPQMRENTLKELRGAPLSVYIGIVSHMNWGAQSFPSLETLSKETGYSVRWVKDALHFLKKRGFIIPVIARRGHSTVYQVNHWFSIGGDEKGEVFDKTGEVECPHKKNIEEEKKNEYISTYYNNSSYGGSGVPLSGEVKFPREDKIAPELWEKVKDKVQGQIAKGNYDTWIKDTRGLRFSDSTMVVAAPSNFVQEYIERFLYSYLLKSTVEVSGRRVKLEFQTS